ncbi:glycosyltransferase [Egicoccus halophilus]|uniref:Glycosyl transferase n=1 Tax=Egicoccus halophilus TaxID=1670830 RepID=A0A8J3A9H2_9ACTN|nr:glycosyltransferase [Egicoccus halophilus]GGI05400.1 glycosyl transferase [Egicoccus halophilus]
MKVLHVLDELRPSGAETMLRIAAPYWQAQGVEVHALATGAEPGPYAPTLARAGVLIHHLPLTQRATFIAQFVRLLRDEEVDVVHLHMERANFPLAVLARAAGRRRIVRTVHNVFAFEGTLRVERIVQRFLQRLMGVRAAAVSPSVAANELRRFGHRTEIVPNTYDSRRFVPPGPQERQELRKEFGIGDKFVLAVVGNCSDVKNHEALLLAMDRLHKGGHAVRLLHAGIEGEVGSAERQVAANLGLKEHIDFFGFVEDIAPLLRASDCFVMPSLYEGLGNAALEAAGCGLPLVLADVPGLKDLGPTIPSVRLVPPYADEIAAAIVALIESGENGRDSLGRSGARAVAEAFSPQHHAENYFRLYNARHLG